MAECRLWRYLRSRQLEGHRIRRQSPIGRYIVDFVCFDRRLVIGVDGGQHAEKADDGERTRWLEGEGLRVLRFWNRDVLQITEGVIEIIRNALHR